MVHLSGRQYAREQKFLTGTEKDEGSRGWDSEEAGKGCEDAETGKGGKERRNMTIARGENSECINTIDWRLTANIARSHRYIPVGYCQYPANGLN